MQAQYTSAAFYYYKSGGNWLSLSNWSAQTDSGSSGPLSGASSPAMYLARFRLPCAPIFRRTSWASMHRHLYRRTHFANLEHPQQPLLRLDGIPLCDGVFGLRLLHQSARLQSSFRILVTWALSAKSTLWNCSKPRLMRTFRLVRRVLQF
jgi:hypothetical protein